MKSRYVALFLAIASQAFAQTEPPVRTIAPGLSIADGKSDHVADVVAQEKMTAVADRLQEAIRAANPSRTDDGFGAIELDDGRSIVHVYWKQGAGMPEALHEIAASSTLEGIEVRFHQTPFSRADLAAEAEALMNGDAGAAFSEVSVQPMVSGLAVEIDVAADPALARKAVANLTSRLRGRRALGAPEGLDITQSVGRAKTPLSRANDSSPWKGGAEIQSENRLCSSGFAVGSWFGRYMLTAGHCVGYADNVQVRDGAGELMGVTEGARHARTRYVDSTLVKLNSWRNIGRIYDGGVSGWDEFTKPVKRPIGTYVNQYLCTSGAFSGAICDIKVEAILTWVRNEAGLAFGPVMKARQLGGRASMGTGDSGGPVFALDSQSNVLGVGIIQGGGSTVSCQGVLWDSRFGRRTCFNTLYFTDMWTLLDTHGVWLETN